jgi:hypothetical protein
MDDQQVPTHPLFDDKLLVLLCKCEDAWGADSQIRVAQEELCELAACINQFASGFRALLSENIEDCFDWLRSSERDLAVPRCVVLRWMVQRRGDRFEVCPGEASAHLVALENMALRGFRGQRETWV